MEHDLMQNYTIVPSGTLFVTPAGQFTTGYANTYTNVATFSFAPSISVAHQGLGRVLAALRQLNDTLAGI